ncbi:imidazolonepropionase [bacterium]|nr:imidazolonepropionase [bacterium]
MRTRYERIAWLIGAYREPKERFKGAEMQEFSVLKNAWLETENGRVLDFGTMESFPAGHTDEVVDCTGRVLMPAFVDSHTHIVFARWRESEFVDRIGGLSYEEIAQKGGGILNSALALADADPSRLLDDAYARVEAMMAQGTAALEIKSGYGLSEASELKMLRVIRDLKERAPIPIKSSFLGAHAVPLAYKNDRAGYVDLLIDRILPQIAAEGLADYMDVFCDRGFFTVPETDRLLEAGWKHGLRPKIHANELDFSGGVQVGVRHNALSVDHLECMGEAEIQTLLGTETMPTLLPGTAFFLGLHPPPARTLIDSGLGVALASDYNPGSSPSGSMPFVLALGCVLLKMKPIETFAAATLNGAYALELQSELGTLSPGKRAALVLSKPVSSPDFLCYAYTEPWIERVELGRALPTK